MPLSSMVIRSPSRGGWHAGKSISPISKCCAEKTVEFNQPLGRNKTEDLSHCKGHLIVFPDGLLLQRGKEFPIITSQPFKALMFCSHRRFYGHKHIFHFQLLDLCMWDLNRLFLNTCCLFCLWGWNKRSVMDSYIYFFNKFPSYTWGRTITFSQKCLSGPKMDL